MALYDYTTCAGCCSCSCCFPKTPLPARPSQVLNQIVADAFAGKELSEKKLKEVLGHTPLQVFMGAVLGVGTAVVYLSRYAA